MPTALSDTSLSPAPATKIPATLVLEDGRAFAGFTIGKPGTTLGELVFNTSLTGYQEILTDPSYNGQIVMMTYPEIGNYGVTDEDYESASIHASGFVVRRLSPVTSSWRAQHTLQDFLLRNNIIGIEGVDTRALTRAIRDAGAMKCGITTDDLSDATTLQNFVTQVKQQPGLEAQDLVGQVSTPEVRVIENNTNDVLLSTIVVLDYGIKESILKYLSAFAKTLYVLPAHSEFDTIMGYQPDGILLSNGPGDPSILTGIINTARRLVESGTPIFGICLGHQILALACGATVEKMPFGHHGGNHPVLDLENNLITITSQNHGYAVVVDESFPADKLKITHVNLNDQTVEGFRHLNYPVMSVQFHPEASPGPHDAQYLFARFAEGIAQKHKR